MLSLIGAIITGAVLGALARLVMWGEQNIPVLWTIVLDTVDVLIGGAIASLSGVARTDGIDWIRRALPLVVTIMAIPTRLGVTGCKQPFSVLKWVPQRHSPFPRNPLQLL